MSDKQTQTDVEINKAFPLDIRSRMNSAPLESSKRSTKAPRIVVQQALSTDEDDGDLASAVSNPPNIAYSRPINGNAPCMNCRKLMIDIDHLKDSMKQTEDELDNLTTLLNEEKEKNERLQLSKDMLDQELEELTAQLFDQANKMVIEEARMRDDLETSNKELKGELGEMVRKFESREKELRDLKKYISAIENAKQRANVSNTVTPIGSNPNIRNSVTASSANIKFPVPLSIDGLLFQEFQEFVQKLHATPQLPLSGLLLLPFMRRCISEDVEPCLFYTYQYPGSNIKATAFTSSLKRKLLDALTNLQFEIKDAETRTKTKCGFCTLQKECGYTSTFGVGKEQQTLSTCRFCHDRMMSIQEFFQFIHVSRQGSVNPGKRSTTILSMLRQVWSLRRKIAVSRIGNCALFEGDAPSSTLGNDWENTVTILN
jgi:hypothetical protein